MGLDDMEDEFEADVAAVLRELERQFDPVDVTPEDDDFGFGSSDTTRAFILRARGD